MAWRCFFQFWSKQFFLLRSCSHLDQKEFQKIIRKNKALRRQAIFVGGERTVLFRDHSGYPNLISEIFDSEKFQAFG